MTEKRIVRRSSLPFHIQAPAWETTKICSGLLWHFRNFDCSHAHMMAASGAEMWNKDIFYLEFSRYENRIRYFCDISVERESFACNNHEFIFSSFSSYLSLMWVVCRCKTLIYKLRIYWETLLSENFENLKFPLKLTWKFADVLHSRRWCLFKLG